MTSAKRPTQEVAPRRDWREQLWDARAALPDLLALLEAPNPRLAIQTAIEAIDYRLGLVAQWAEASRSAPPAAVTAEQLAGILRDGDIGCEDHRERHGGYHLATAHLEDAAYILSKITPAQPSASSEGDGPCDRLIDAVRIILINEVPSDEAWRDLNEAYDAALAAKPTGSADEPLLRAADSDAFYKGGKWHRRTVELLGLLSDAVKVQRNPCSHLGIGSPGCVTCDPRIRDNLGIGQTEVGAALASAEPAEVDGE